MTAIISVPFGHTTSTANHVRNARLTRKRLVTSLLVATSPLAAARTMATPPAAGTYAITPTELSAGVNLTATTITPPVNANPGTPVTITTTTISGNTAFNAFNDFAVGTGVAVNLVVPTSGTATRVTNLVNVVANQVNINGSVFSSITNASNVNVVGGHVFFVAPNGFVLGAQGVLNVGALTVETANLSLAKSGALSLPDFPTASVLNGTIALDGSGAIDIQGQIFASGVNDLSGNGSVSLLSGKTITLASGSAINAGGAAPLAAFLAVVAPGVTSASGVTIAAGGDVILTGSDVEIGGMVSANSLGAATPGKIAVSATKFGLNTKEAAGGNLAVVGSLSALGAAGATGGRIDIAVTNSETVQLGKATANSAVTIDGRISGGDVTINATATAIAKASILPLPGSDPTTDFDKAGLVGKNLLLLAGLAGGYVNGDGTTSITFSGNANVQASGPLTVAAKTIAEAAQPLINRFSPTPLAISVNYGEVSANSTLTVASGATLHSGGALSLLAENTGTLNVSSLTIKTGAPGESSMADSISIGTATIDSTLSVANGALISGSSVSAVAQNTNDFSVSATTYATQGAVAGVAIAVKETSSSATNTFAADIGTAAVRGGALNVQAIDDTINNAASASDGTGPTLAGKIFDATKSIPVGAATSAWGKITAKFSKVDTSLKKTETSADKDNNTQKSGNTFRLAGAVDVNLSNSSAIATVGAATGAPTAIYSNGDVVIAAQVSDLGVRSLAQAEVASEQAQSPAKPGDPSRFSVSAAVAYGDFTHVTKALVAPSTVVDAKRIAVAAQTVQPITDNFISSLTDPTFGSVLSHLNPNLGVVNNIMTSYANSQSRGEELSISGTVNLFTTNTTTDAWVGANAKLTTAASAPATWTFTLHDSTIFGNGVTPTPGPNAVAYTSGPAWTSGLVVAAFTENSSIDVAGNFGVISTLKQVATTPVANDSTSVGAAYNGVTHNVTTLAGIDAGAMVTARTGLLVSALTNNQIVALAPSSGGGTGIGGSGMVSLLQIENRTHATISNAATISAPSLTLTGVQAFELINLAADYISGGTAALGIAIAATSFDADTTAHIGVATGDAGLVYGTAAPAAPTVGGTISVDSLKIHADTIGYAAGGGIAGAKAVGEPEKKPDLGSSDYDSAKNPGGKQSAGTEDIIESGGFADFWAQVEKDAEPGGAPKTDAASTAPKFSIAGAGSAVLSFSKVNSNAGVQGLGTTAGTLVNIGSYTASGAVTTDIRAFNNPTLVAGAGAGAKISDKNMSPNTAAIAGAITVQLADNHSVATLNNAKLVGAGATDVQALVGGIAVSAAIASAASENATAPSSKSAAVVLSVLINTDQASASINSSTITGLTGGANRNLTVTAYDDSNIGVGGGAGYSGAKLGLGAALTYVSVGDPTGGKAVYAGVNNSTLTVLDKASVQAGDASVIIGLAGVSGEGTDASNNLSGSAVNLSLSRTVQADVIGSTIAAGAITVTADGLRQAALDSLLLSASPGSSGTGYDFGGGSSDDDLIADGDGTALAVGSGKGQLIIALAGQKTTSAGTTGNTIGASYAGGQLTGSHKAYVGNSILTATGGKISVTASDDALLVAAAVGASKGGNFGLVGSLAFLHNSDAVTANIDTGSVLTSSKIELKATNAATLASLAGAFAKSQSAAVGAAIAVMTATGKSSATAKNATLQASSALDVEAANTGLLVDISIAGASSEKLTLAGAFTTNVVQQGALASLTNVTDAAGGTVSLFANSAQTIYAGAIAAGYSGQSGAGVGVVTNVLGNDDDGYRAGTLVDGGTLTVSNLKLSSDAAATVNVIGVGVQVAKGPLGAAGSVLTNVNRGTVSSTVTGGAVVTAQNNVGVLAASTDTIRAISGAVGFGKTAGIGVSIVTNVLTGTTSAAISGATTKVTALASAPTTTLTVKTGALTSPVDLGDINSLDNPVLSGLALATKTVTGVAVNAASTEQTVVAALSLGLSKQVGVAVNIVTDVTGGTTSATIEQAEVNQGAGTAGATQVVDVVAADHAYAANLVGSVGIGKEGGFAAAINTAGFVRTTDAHITDGSISANKAVAVTATSSQTDVGLTIGGAGGKVAAAASLTVATFAADTRAYAKGGTINAAAFDVTAKNTVGDNINTGAVAIGQVAVGGGFDVSVNNNTTFAGLGRSKVATSSDAGFSGVTVNADSTNVHAITVADWHLHTVGGSVASTAAVAAMGGLLLSHSDTEAAVYGGTVQALGSSPGARQQASLLDVKATNTVSGDLITGALALSGSVGVGAAIGVVIDSDAVGATISGANVLADAIAVNAEFDRDLKMLLITGAAGKDVGIGATVGVILLGGGVAGGYGADAFSQLLPTLSAISSGARNLLAGNGNTLLTAGEQTLTNGASSFSTPDNLSAVQTSSVLAEVKGSTLKGNSVTVATDVKTATKQLDGALAAGTVGVGAGVGYTGLTDRITSSINPNSTVTAGTITVKAVTSDNGSKHAGDIDAYVGSAGLVGLGAAVAIVDNAMVINAEAGGSLTGTGGAGDRLSVTASDTTSAATETFSVQVGAVAGGAVVSQITKGGSVTAQVLPTATGPVTSVTRFNSVDVSSLVTGTLTAKGLAAAGGALAALAGADASATDRTNADAKLGRATFGAAAGGITVAVLRTPATKANAIGASLGGGLAVGASLATAEVGGHAIAQVASGASFANGASLTVKAFMTRDSAGNDSTNADSIAGAGSLYVAASAAVATATNNSSVQAFVNQGVGFGSGNLTIQADRDTSQKAKSLGVSASGLLAVGATVVTTNSGGDISAWLDKGFYNVNGGPAVVMGSLTISAGSGIGTTNPAVTSGLTDDRASATSISGSGAPLAGTAAVATANQTATVYAGIKDFAAPTAGGTYATIAALDGINIGTNYITQSTVSSDTIQAALAGASGAVTTRNVTPTLTTEIGSNLTLETRGNLLVTALDQATLGGLTFTGAGGLLNGNAAIDAANVHPVVRVNVGANDTLAVLGDPSNQAGNLRLIAGSLVTGTDTGTMTTGGGIQAPFVSSKIIANLDNTINVADDVTMLSVGALSIGDYGIATITTNVDVSTYGGAGVAGGESIAEATANNTINIGKRGLLAAYGNITLAAGQSGDGFVNTLLVTKATSEVFNYTILALDTREYARAQTDSNATLNIGTGTDIQGVANVSLIAYDPVRTPSASGKGHNPYLSIFGLTTDDSHPVSNSTAVINFAGTANAGVLAKQSIDITADGVLTLGGALRNVPRGLAALGQAALQPSKAAVAGFYDTYDSLQAQINAQTAIRDAASDPTARIKAQAAIDALLALQASAPFTTVTTTVPAGPPSAAVLALRKAEYDKVIGQLNAVVASTTATAADKQTATTNLAILAGLFMTSPETAYAQAINYDTLAETAINPVTPGSPTVQIVTKVGVAVPSVTTAALYAAAGDLTIKAKSFTDTNTSANSLTAQGGVAVTITDARTGVPNGADLVVGAIDIPVDHATGGNVYFLGGATAPAASIIRSTGVNLAPAITISNTSSNASGAPLILLNGRLDNDGGVVTVSNLQGDIGQYAEINALSLNIIAPQGIYAVPNLNGTAQAGANPEDLWAPFQIVSTSTSANDLAYYEANAQFNSDGRFTSAGSLTNYLIANNSVRGSQDNAGGKYGVNYCATGATNCVNTMLLYTNVPVPNGGDTQLYGSVFHFQNVPVKTLTLSKTAASEPVDNSTGITAAAVFINASNINVRKIRAGASNWSATIADTQELKNAVSYLDLLQTIGVGSTTPVDLTSLVSKNAGDQQLSVAYDAVAKQFVLGGVKGGAAGLVQLTGGIANTSATRGSIVVNNGLAAINVTNATTTGLQVSTLNAGAPSAAMVIITDTNHKINNTPVTTWYVQNPGETAHQYDDVNQINAGVPTGLAGARDITPTNGDLNFTPVDNLRYVWTDTFKAERTINQPGSYVYDWSANPWNVTFGSLTSKNFTTTNTDTDFFNTRLTGSITSTSDNSFGIGCNCRGLPDGSPFIVYATDVTGVQVVETSSVKANNPIKISFNGNASGTINIASQGSVFLTGRVSNPVGTTSITVKDALGNLSGSIQEAGGSVTAQKLTLAAASIGYNTGGAVSTPLALNLTNGSTLDVRTSSGVNVAVNGAANLLAASANNGDVSISATQGIYAAAGGAAIVGDNITLVGGAGGVGTSTSPIKIAATKQATGANDHGVLNASAIQDIVVTKTSGDLLLGEVVSSNGAVTLVADTGSIANALTAFTVDTANAAALAKVWTKLNLQDRDAAIAQTLTPFQNIVNANYREYWAIQQNATITGGTVSLDPSQTLLFSGSAFASGTTLTSTDHALLVKIVANSTITGGNTPQVALTATQQDLFSGQVMTALNLTRAPTGAEINTYVQGKYVTYYAATTAYVADRNTKIAAFANDTTVFTAGAPAGFFTAPVAATPYAYVLTRASDAALYDRLTYGAGAWTSSQLANSINANALVPVSNTNILRQAPNAAAKSVTLQAPTGAIGNNLALNITAADGTISADGGSVVVDIRRPENLTDTVRALLAAAAPGDLVINSSGGIPVSVTISLPHLVGVNTTGNITATAAGNIFLGSNNAGVLRRIDSDNGQVRLNFGGALTNNAPTGDTAVKGGFLILEAANGDIGTSVRPLTTSIYYDAAGQPTPTLNSVRGINVYLSEILDSRSPTRLEANDLRLGVGFASGALNLAAPTGAISSALPYAANTVRLQGNTVVFAAAGDIGTTTTPLQVQASGLTTATGRNLYLHNPALLRFGASALTGFTALTGGGYTFTDIFTTAGGITIASTGPVTLSAPATATTAAGSILGTNGAVTIDATSISLGNGARIAMTGASAGLVSLNSTTGPIALDTGASLVGSALTLQSATSVAVGASNTLTAANGNIAITPTTTLTVGDNSVFNATGAISLGGQNTLLGSRDTLTAGGSILLTSAQSIIGGTFNTLSAGGPLTVVAGTVGFGNSLKATAGATAVAFTSTVSTLAIGDNSSVTGPVVSMTAKTNLGVGSSVAFTAKTGSVGFSATSIRLGSQDSLTAAQNVDIVDTGTLTAGDGLALNATTGTVTVTAGDASFGQALSAQSPGQITFTTTQGALTMIGGETIRAQSLTLAAKSTLSLGNSAQITSTSLLKATGANIILGASDMLTASGALSLAALGGVTANGPATLSSLGSTLAVSGQTINFAGALTANAAAAMTFNASAGSVQLGSNSNIRASNSLVLTGPSGLTVGSGSLVSVGSNLNWTAYQPATFGAGVRITVGGAVTGTSTSLSFGSQAILTANGAIGLTTTGGGMLLGALQSNLGGGTAINLTSAGSILGNNDGQTNLTTSGSAGLLLSANGDIGSSQTALSIRTQGLTSSSRGSTWLRSLGNLLTRKTTGTGPITINGQRVASN